MSLIFAPDGKTLVSVNGDRTMTLWELPSGRLLRTLPDRRARRVVWSRDGRTLASLSHDKTIWLWDVEQDRYRAVLRGHTADIYDMAFTPDSSRLLSGSADSTLRVWDVETRGVCASSQATRFPSMTLTGVPIARLISGGSDGMVTIWDIRGERSPTVLHGHSQIVRGVGWSPDGRFLASSGWDTVLRLWDPTSHTSVQEFESSAILEGMAWSPDGNLLACGTYLRGMQVWDVRVGSLRWIGRTHLIGFSDVAWSPDGTQLVGGGDDGCIYLWEGVDGTLQRRLSGHHSRVGVWGGVPMGSG